MALNLGPGDDVCRFVRLRFADGEPMCIERAAIPARYLPDPTVVDQSLYAALRADGLEPVRALQHLRAAALEAGDAEHLEAAGRHAGDGHGAAGLSRRRPADRAHPLDLPRRSLRLRRRDAARLTDGQLTERSTIEGRIVTEDGHRPGPARPSTHQILAIEPDDGRHRRATDRAGLRRPARAWRWRRRRHGRRRCGPHHGAVPCAARHDDPARDHRDRTRGDAADRASPASARPWRRRHRTRPRCIGVHLEGPFISPEALGAQPPFAIPPDLDLVAELHELAAIRVATMAPEIDPDGRLLAWFVAHGVQGAARPHALQLRRGQGGARRRGCRLHPSLQRDDRAAASQRRAPSAAPWRMPATPS